MSETRTAGWERWIKTGRRRPLVPDAEGVDVSLDASAVERILPHREPVRFVDGVERVALEGEAGPWILAFRENPPSDPIFAGHFPDYPLLPGTFQLEAVGQAGACLEWFLSAGTPALPPNATPTAVRALKVHHAAFLAEVRPGERLRLFAQVLERDEYGSTFFAQSFVDDRVCTVTVGEMFFPDTEA